RRKARRDERYEQRHLPPAARRPLAHRSRQSLGDGHRGVGPAARSGIQRPLGSGGGVTSLRVVASTTWSMTIVSGTSLVSRMKPIWKKTGFSSFRVAVFARGTTFSPSNQTSTKPFSGSRDQRTWSAKSCQRPAVSFPLPVQWSL